LQPRPVNVARQIDSCRAHRPHYLMGL